MVSRQPSQVLYPHKPTNLKNCGAPYVGNSLDLLSSVRLIEICPVAMKAVQEVTHVVYLFGDDLTLSSQDPCTDRVIPSVYKTDTPR